MRDYYVLQNFNGL